MFASNLPGPVLSLALDPLAGIEQSDGIAVGGLWSVLTKVRDAVVEGQRLENLTWRLWYRTRAKPGLFPYKSTANTFPVSNIVSPSFSVLSSSDGTSISTDWDRETAVGEGDEPGLFSHNGQGTLKDTVISPPVQYSHLHLGVTSNLLSPRPIHCTSSQGVQQDAVQKHFAQQLPPASPAQSVPHNLQISRDHTSGAQAQGNSPSSSQDLPLNHAQIPSIPASPLLSPHEPKSPLMSSKNDASSNIAPDAHLLLSLSESSVTSASIVIANTTLPSSIKCASMSMPTPLLTPRKDDSTVGRLIARLFTDSTINMRDTNSIQKIVSSGKRHLTAAENPTLVTPRIFEPHPLPSVVPGSPVTGTPVPTSAMSTPRQCFPTVVVVNPTPHPTPPATPSPEESDTQANSVAIIRGNRPPEAGWGRGSGPPNGQLSTPVSMNGDAGSANDSEPESRLEQQSHLGPYSHYSLGVRNNTAANSTGMIVLPERPMECDVAAHLPTPAAEMVSPSEMAHCVATKTMTVPIPAAAAMPAEDKKFFLAAPHSGSGGSGHDSTESPGSSRLGSVSPLKRSVVEAPSLLSPKGQRDDGRKEEHASSSFSASSPRAASITSSKGGSSRHKGRAAFTMSGSSKRKTGKKVVLSPKHSHVVNRKDADILSATPEKAENRLVEKDERSVSSKGKEREVEERRESNAAAVEASTMATMPRAKTLQQTLSHRSTSHHQYPAHHLRQLPTNPPKRQESPRRRDDTESIEGQSRNPQVKRDSHQAPHHPHVPHLALGHLPSIPPRPRRAIEIAETSSDYSTTDTDGDDDSSWESESISEGNAQKPSATQSGPSRTNQKGSSSLKSEKKVARASGSHNRTRDPGEFARDAALEAQRQKDMFQKLPERSYSNLGQLPRAKSGLSLLFRPDPESFPEGHPYRTSRSSQDLLARNWTSPALPLAMTALTKRASAVQPVQATVNVSSVKSKTDLAEMVNSRRSSAPQRSGYRPRVKPADQVEESDTGDEDPNDVIQVPSSIAERRLAALVRGRGAKSLSQPRNPSPAQGPPQHADDAPSPQPITRTATMPVTMHQILPEPVPLQTPHTIRRKIISDELDEELRRNLLWERSQNQVQGRPPRAPGSILPGPWRTLAFTPLKPTETANSESNANGTGTGNRSFATQRTKSWAGDYHASGW